MVVCNTGDDFEHLGLSDLARSRHRALHAGRDRQSRRPAGAARTRPGASWPRWPSSAARPGSSSAIATSRPTSSAPGGSPPARRSRAISADFARRLGVRARLMPMCDEPVRTMVHTADGVLPFQRYFVEQRCAPVVRGFAFEGVEAARPPAALLEVAREREPRGGGDLPVQPLHQHRPDPRRAGHARGARRQPGAGRRGLADHRRARGQGPDRQDDGRARPRDHLPRRSPSTTPACSTASCSTAPMPGRPRRSGCRAS